MSNEKGSQKERKRGAKQRSTSKARQGEAGQSKGVQSSRSKPVQSSYLLAVRWKFTPHLREWDGDGEMKSGGEEEDDGPDYGSPTGSQIKNICCAVVLLFPQIKEDGNEKTAASCGWRRLEVEGASRGQCGVNFNMPKITTTTTKETFHGWRK